MSVSAPQDRYQEMIARYNENANSLHSMNEDPYNEKNIAIREFEEKLAVVAAENRSKCATVHDVYELLGKKYFGEGESSYTDRLNADDATRAMYDNELNATLYGTYQNSNLDDPRINWNSEDWESQLLKDKESNQRIISTQMKNLLEKKGINVEDGDTLLISFDPYEYLISIEGLRNTNNLSKVNEILKEGENAKELFNYTLQNSGSVNQEALTKYKAYQNIKNLTGENLGELTLRNGNFYTEEGRNILSLIKQGIDKDTLIPQDFKNVAYDYSKRLLKEVAEKGFNSMPDLELTIGYSKEYGFFSTSNLMYVA